VLTADRGDDGQRLDLVVRRHLMDLPRATRTRVQAWIEAGLVTLNGDPVRRVSRRTSLGDIVSVALPDGKTRAPMEAEEAGLDVIHEDDHLIAIVKPAGLVVHPTYKHASGTLLNALLGHARTWPVPQRPSLVSRLDKLTSGVVVVAKHAAAHAALQRAMAMNDCEKDYLAIVYGRVNVLRGAIDLRLAKDREDHRRVAASATAGAESLTRFVRLDRVAAPRAGLSLLRCRLATGRTHQIRVHLAARGWPLVGDPMYGEPRWSAIDDQHLGAALRAFPRQALHAWRVTFVHPFTRARVTIEAPIPEDFQRLLDTAGLSFGRDSHAGSKQVR
jgi:23S rRNA pseudouridine1911/1915/1917 synthase